MKKHAVIITAYKAPEMLDALLNELSEAFECFGHIDVRFWRNFEYLTDKYSKTHFILKYLIN